MRGGDRRYIDSDLFHYLYVESRVQLAGHPLHNKHINYYGPRDTTPVYTPSRYYEFLDIQCDIQHTEQDADQPECGIYISYPDEAVTQSLLTTCHNISRHQPVTDLYLWGVECRDLPAAVEAPIMSRNARSLWLSLCDLPVRFIRQILRQLIDSDCITLQKLKMGDMDLSEVEAQLEELMEQLVSHHEAGAAQEKLEVQLHNLVLSWKFVEKWRRRCEGITSIDCMIHDDVDYYDDHGDDDDDDDDDDNAGHGGDDRIPQLFDQSLW